MRCAERLLDFGQSISTTSGRAAVQGIALEVSDWGFRLEDIRVHVDIWHGAQDRNVPVINGVRQVNAIPNSTLHRINDAGHWLILDHLGAILRLIAP